MTLSFFGRAAGKTSRAAQDAQLRAMTEEVRAYWEGLRRGGDLPERSQIDPRGMEGALRGTFLAERIAPGVARLRIAGMNFTDLLGMDARGMPLSALFDPMSRARLSVLLDSCFLRPAVLDLALGCEMGIGRPDLRARMILLPLAGDGSRGEMALGCLALADQIGRQPRRLVIESATTTPVRLPQLQPAVPLQVLTEIAKRAGNAASTATPQPGHLRLVTQDGEKIG
ncbi:PAS domain-containing protein [Gemmobacter serpentinus]|uniref:PAS domain-containing protein n=1 Tax=Gemmobacter serpentinus TaxID=2652247 RepID=UPI00124EEE0D|nr:PAS domain-containing protein [Gemmobacter serpentinus]